MLFTDEDHIYFVIKKPRRILNNISAVEKSFLSWFNETLVQINTRFDTHDNRRTKYLKSFIAYQVCFRFHLVKSYICGHVCYSIFCKFVRI